MPVKIPVNLPAKKLLEQENIFVMTEARAETQEIRPLKIAILNLMPTKEVTETQLLRLIGNTPLQVEVVLLRTATYKSQNTPEKHLAQFYRTFEDVKRGNEKYDGLIITGAPVEKMDFEEVTYWRELTKIMKWADKNVFSTLYICWAAQAGLYYHYGIKKYDSDKKVFGVFTHRVLNPHNPIVRGFDEAFLAPHSRHTLVKREDILACDKLELLSESDDAGVYLAASRDLRQIFVTGHGEYDADTLDREYKRDLGKSLIDLLENHDKCDADTLERKYQHELASGFHVDIPKNYYPGNDITKKPANVWRAHSHLLIANWLNYCVYQETPFDITKIN